MTRMPYLIRASVCLLSFVCPLSAAFHETVLPGWTEADIVQRYNECQAAVAANGYDNRAESIVSAIQRVTEGVFTMPCSRALRWAQAPIFACTMDHTNYFHQPVRPVTSSDDLGRFLQEFLTFGKAPSTFR